MKKSAFLLSMFFVALLFQQCKKTNEEEKSTEFTPSSFSVDIPSAISSEASTLKNGSVGVVQGNQIYAHLRTFVGVGEFSAKFVETVIKGIKFVGAADIDSIRYLSKNTKDDQRLKDLVIKENQEFEGRTWEYMAKIVDVDTGTKPFDGKAMEVFWNTNPVEGIAIVNPFNCNQTENVLLKEVMYRVEYKETGENGYSKQMVVSIYNLPLPSSAVVSANADKQYSMRNLKMFAGKKGDIIEVRGNSDHPLVKYVTQEGFNWAFVAASDANLNIAVAEVGLPGRNVNSSDRAVLLDTSSIRNVLRREADTIISGTSFEITPGFFVTGANLKQIFPQQYNDTLNKYLVNTTPPAYFNNGGFSSAGMVPSNNSNTYSSLKTAIKSLSPYKPKDITDLMVEFKD